jgi:hypothetical protein
MKKTNEISTELNTLSPLLAGLERINVYAAPDGYFDALPDMALSFAKDEESRDLILQNRENSLSLPADYFDNLASQILSTIKAQDNNIEEELPQILKPYQHTNVYTLPAGYFENLSGKILSKLDEDNFGQELKSLSPLLFSLQKIHVYTVAPQYFNSLDAGREPIAVSNSSRLLSFNKTSSWIKYAAAAVFTGLMVLGSYTIIAPQKNDYALTAAQKSGLEIVKQNSFDTEFAKVSDDEIVNFLTKDGVDVEMAVAFTKMEEKAAEDESKNAKPESVEIDELLNQLDENNAMN